jgi:hypothetical protein
VPKSYSALQFDSSVLKPNVALLKNAGDRLLITYGAVSAAKRLAERARQAPEPLGASADRVGIDLSDASAIARFMLRGSIAANPRGITLFSSTDASRMRSNSQALREGPPSDKALEAFRDFAARAQTTG